MISLGKYFVCSSSQKNFLPHLRLAHSVLNARVVHSRITNQIIQKNIVVPNKIFSTDRTTNYETKSEKVGICEKLVRSSGPLEPYLKLIRLHKPTG